MSNNFSVVAQTKDLQRAINLASTIVEKKNVIPILNNLKLETTDNLLRITATDMALSVDQEIGVQVKSHDKITVSSQVLGDIMKKITDEEIRLESIGDMLQVRTENCKFNLPIISASQFPKTDDITSKGEINISAKNFVKILEYTKFSMSNEETRYNLNGVLLSIKNDNKLTAVSTDGHRLSIASLRLDKEYEDVSLILPKKTVNELVKILKDTIFLDRNITIYFGVNKIRIMCDSLIITSKLIDSSYPDYRGFIPVDNNNILTVNAQIICEAIDRVDIMTMDKLRAVKLGISSKNLEIQTNSDSKGEAREIIILGEQDNSHGSYRGENLTIGFNPKYLLDVFTCIKEGDAEINLKDGMSPILIKSSSNPDCCFIIMPIRV